MKIETIKIKNFKFHKNFDFSIQTQNCLLYGENGSGKSSIYWALYSLYKVYFKDNHYDFQKFKNKASEDDIDIEIKLTNDTLNIPKAEYNLPTDISQENEHTIFFANQDLLHEITNLNNQDFYNILSLYLNDYFKKINNFIDAYKSINIDLSADNHVEKTKIKNEIDESFVVFLEELSNYANEIIKADFKENFEIDFQFRGGELDPSGRDLIFSKPQVFLQINNEKNLKWHFNEAKLKLTSVAIFFALVLLEEKKENPLKILVLDDFLTSLDMSNRHYIIEYILKSFNDYQKIIFTHNIQFFNLTSKVISLHNESELWDIKNIFLRDQQNDESLIYDKNQNYLSKASEELDKNELQISGNFIRKEFERVMNELKQIFELGKSEELNNMIQSIQNSKILLPKPNQAINDLLTDLDNILGNAHQRDSAKVVQLRIIIDRFKHHITVQGRKYKIGDLKSVVSNTAFYKDVLMNPSSHDDGDKELYRKECTNAYKLVKYLNDCLSALKS